MTTFSGRLALARKQRGMTQADVAERLNVSFQAVSQWERGETSPEIDKLVDLAQLFGVTTDYLLMGREERPVLADIGPLSDRLFNEEHMYTFVKTYAVALDMYQTLRVLPYAKELHEGQVRKGRDRVPFIYHPLLMACHALALGLRDDNLISTVILHDVCEDCGISPQELPVNEETRRAVELLTFNEEAEDQEEEYARYYAAIAENPIASMVKLLDRCCNISGIASGFSQEKIIGYIRNTERYIYPLMRGTRRRYPQYGNQVFLIKYHLISVVETIRHQLGGAAG